MWPLRRNVQYNKESFFQDIFIFVSIVHLFVLILCCCIDTGKFHHEKFVLQHTTLHSTVVFMPLQKRVLQQSSVAEHSIPHESKPNIISYDQYQKQSLALHKHHADRTIPAVEKKSIKKSMIKTTPKTDVPHKKSPTKIAPVVSSKKNVEKKSKEIATKNNPAKISEEKIVPTEHSKVQDQPQQDKDTAVEQSREILVDRHQAIASLDPDQVSYIGSRDLEMIEIKEKIQFELVKYYKPPVGIAKTAVCELAVVVGVNGKAQQVTIKKRSGSIANDICARAALLQVSFPKETIGKEIIVELGQS